MALVGKQLVFTGALTLKRAEAKSLAEKAGATVTGSVSGKTDIVVAGPDALDTAKIKQAKAKGGLVWTEEEFTNAAKGSKAKAPKAKAKAESKANAKAKAVAKSAAASTAGPKRVLKRPPADAPGGGLGGVTPRVWPPSLAQQRPSLGTNELPIRPKNLRIKPQKYFFMPRSMLMLPGLKIPIKSEKIIDFWNIYFSKIMIFKKTVEII